MRNIIIIVAAFILTGCSIPTLDDLYFQQSNCEATGEDCVAIAEKIESRERRLDRMSTGTCPPGYIEYLDRHGLKCIDRRQAMDSINRRY